VLQCYSVHDYLAIDFSLSIAKKILALISIEREFLSVDVKNDVVQIFSDIGELIWERQKFKCVTELFI